MAFSFGVDSKAPNYKITKHLRLIELFAGVGTQAMALRDIGADFERYRVVEFDKDAVASYNAIHGTNFPVTDIRNIKSEDLGIVDKDKYEYLMFYSFPCFTGDTLVLTNNGLKEIKKVEVNDTVMSHDGTYKKVLSSKKTGTKETFGLSTMASPETICTGNHKFFARKMYRKNGKRLFSNPEWVQYNDLDKSYYLGYPVNCNSIIPDWDGATFTWSDNRKPRCVNELSNLLDKESFWWLIGRYIGDGWERTQGGIIICCAKGEESDIIKNLIDCGFNYNLVKDRTCYKIHIPLKELSSFTNQFGKYAYGKYLPGFMFDLPTNVLKAFINGYWSADGSIDSRNNYRLATVSKSLAMGMVNVISKAYNVPVKVYFNKRKSKVTIEGRTCNQRNGYELRWKLNKSLQNKAFYEDGFVWYPIRKFWKTNKTEDVYDIEVEDNHSFIANNAIVHNCTDLSLSGKRLGMSKGSGTRSGLLWEVERLLDESADRAVKEGKDKSTYLPQILIMENVTQVHNPKNINDWNAWLDKLKSLGYTSVYKDLNARDFNVPQNRLRCFMVSMLGDYNYDFPTPPGLTKGIEEILEPEVDRKFYVTEERRKQLIEDLKNRGYLK